MAIGADGSAAPHGTEPRVPGQVHEEVGGRQCDDEMVCNSSDNRGSSLNGLRQDRAGRAVDRCGDFVAGREEGRLARRSATKGHRLIAVAPITLPTAAALSCVVVLVWIFCFRP